MKLWTKFGSLWGKNKRDADMAEEMRLHLEFQTARNVASGMSADEASYAARRQFGGVEQIKEQCRDERSFVWVEQFLQDGRYAFRTLRKNPGFTLAAVAMLALGIGANAAVFNLVQTLLFSPPAYARPAEVVRVVSVDTKNPKARRDFSYPTFLDLRRSEVFSDALAYRLVVVGVGRLTEARRAMAAIVTSNYFPVLGVTPIRGRGFSADEEMPGHDVPVAIVSYGFWKKNNFDPAIVGSSAQINGRMFTVVGVMPEGFTGAPHLFSTEVWLPLGVYDSISRDLDVNRRSLSDRSGSSLIVLGRLKPGVALEAASTAVTTVAANLEKTFPVEQRDQTFQLERPSRFATAGNDRMVMWVGALLLGMASVVLLVACLNLAGLLLARGAARRREIAIRLALGGGRARIIRQLVTEGLVLAMLGGGGGLLVAVWSSDLLVASLGKLAPIDLAWLPGLNPALVVATFLFCLIATLFFALGPALRMSRADLISHLKENAVTERPRVRRRFLPRNPLVVAQLALSLALLTTAALFIRSAERASAVMTGLDSDGVFLVEVDATLGGIDQKHAQDLYRRMEERFAALPGVESAGISVDVPLGGLDLEKQVRRVGGGEVGRREMAVKWNGVGSDYFKTVSLPVLRGRTFNTAETTQAGGSPVVIVNEVTARELWPEGNALGQRIRFAATGASSEPNGADAERSNADAATTFEVIGVVPAVRHNLFESAPDSAVYLPFAQGFQSHVFFHVKFATLAAANEAATVDMLRRVVSELDATLPILSLKSFKRHLDSNLQIWIVRAGATLFSTFGALALCLSVVGIYGVISYSVSRRTREFGIRMAVGARPGSLQRMILREAAVMLVTGMVIGGVLALGVGKVVSSLLYQVSALDVQAFGVALLVLALAAIVACLIPARRAANVDPMIALRSE